MTIMYKNDNNLDVDNQINKILKGSTPITNLNNNNSSSDSESSEYSEVKPIKNRKKKNYTSSKKNINPVQTTETMTAISEPNKKIKNKSIQVSDLNQSEKQESSIKQTYLKLKDATILLILYIILSSDQMLLIFNKYIPNLGKDTGNKQLLLGLIFRGLILVILFLASKKYII